MPNSLSAKKRLRQSATRQLRNRADKRNMRGQLRRIREAIAAGDVAKTEEEFRSAARTLDKIAAKGVIHANAAARLKSRYSAKVKAAKA